MNILEYLLSEEDPDLMGVSAVSLVFNPANKSTAVLMSESDDVLFKPTNEEERIMKGIFVKAGQPVKQRNGGGVLSKFEAKTIRRMRNRFHKSGADKKVTINHEKEGKNPIYQDDCHVVESYIVDNDYDVKSLKEQGINDAGIGDWVLGVKVSEDVWENDVKTGEVKGLSLEGNFNSRAVAMSHYDVQMARAEKLYKELFNNE